MKAIKWLGIGALVITTTLFWASAQTKQGVRGPKEPLEAELPLLPGAENLQPLALPVVAEESVPDTGTFWSAQRFETEPPLPFSRFPDLPVYSLGNGQMLVDDRAVDIDLYFQQRELQQMLARAAKGESLDEPGGEVLAMRMVQNYNGVDLMLDLEDITNGVAAFTIYCPSNDAGYDLFGTTNLSLATEAGALNATNWVWLYRAAGGETNFTVPMTWEAEAYFRLAGTNDSDADGLSDAFETLTSHSNASTNDTDGDSLLDAWEWAHFGNFEPTGAGDYDGDGYDNAYEQAATSDPNTLTFTAYIGYGQTASLNPTATITLLGGVPADYAVMVDGTNFASPDWQAFTTSPVVPLPDADGEHLVWVALRGRVNATAWQGFGVTLDRVAPALVITGPTNGTTFKPIIQVTGYTTDAVGAVSCTLSNATGLQTNLAALATETDYGPVTTNHFQVFDVELTNGVNALTVQVSDLAGNVSTTNLSITFDTTGDSNAPALAVLWPQSGAKLGADLFTLRARVDDETASVQASVVSPSGATNEYTALVERNGAVWVEDIALEAGTNLVTLTATDAATNSYATNLTVIRSSVSVTIAEPGNLNDAFVSVNGTVSDGSYSVWVNGVLAVVSGNAWSAASVPLAAGGSAVVAVTVIPPDGNGEGGSGGSGGGDPSENNPSDPDGVEFSIQPEKPAEVKLVHGEWELHDYFYDDFDQSGYDGIYNWDILWRWDEKSGGYADQTERKEDSLGVTLSGIRYWVDVGGAERFERWEDEPSNVVSTNAFEIFPATWPGYGENGSWAQGRWAASASYDGNTSISELKATANVVLRTGGRANLERQNLFEMGATATEKLANGTREIPLGQITIPNFGALDSNGVAYAALANNIEVKVTPQAPGGYNTFTYHKQKYKLVSRTVFPALTDTNRSRTKLGVGEEVDLGFSPTPGFVFDWTTTAGSLSSAMNSSTRLTAPSNAAANVAVTATLRGTRSIKFPAFTVVEPSGVDHAEIIGTNSYPLNVSGAGMTNWVWFAPTDVSFYRVSAMEIGKDATNITGFWTQFTPQQLHHSTADQWVQLSSQNSYFDAATYGANGDTEWGDGGGYEWDIPQRWQITGSGLTNTMAGCNQVFSTEASGRARVDKYGNWIRRTTNNVIDAHQQ